MQRPRNRSLCRIPERPPRLAFAPLAWLKLLYLCHVGPTEVGGFGISDPNDLLYVQDFVTVPQEAGPVGVRFTDEGVADHFEHSLALGLRPEAFARLWCHTHPGMSATPSEVDEETFARCFGRCDWAVMFILSRGGRTTARLTCNVGPGAAQALPTAVDWAAWPRCLDASGAELGVLTEAWRREYAAHVRTSAPGPEPERSDVPRSAAAECPWWECQPWSPALDGVCYQPIVEEGLDASFDPGVSEGS